MNGYVHVIEQHRGALVDAMLARIAGASVGDEVLATYLIDGIARHGRGEARRRVAPIRVSGADVPARLGKELVEHVRGLDAQAAPEIDALARAVLHEMPWSADAAESSQTPIDERDVAIAERIAHLDLIDPLTGDHSRAVAAWCRRIATRLGMRRDEVLEASRSGLVHDIGKSAVPIEILKAPRRLEPEERVLMEAHVLFGERYVLQHAPLREFASAVRHHHERFDGRGYPDGIAAARIPLITRIVSVADTFNAIIDRRPYRAPRPPSEALLVLHEERGAQFDPEIVDAMIAVVEAHGS